MAQQGNGVISQNDLMMKLVNAKKVMNKVQTGDYERGNIDESVLRSDPEEYANTLAGKETPPRVATRPMGDMTPDKINNSKLPDAIKRAMIENPIPQITLNDTIDMNIVKGARRIMEREGMISEKPKQKPQSKYQEGNVQRPQQPQYSESIDMNALAILIENTVRRVMDEKLTQLLSAHDTQSINENLVLKVGDSIFKGKITGVNKSK